MTGENITNTAAGVKAVRQKEQKRYAAAAAETQKIDTAQQKEQKRHTAAAERKQSDMRPQRSRAEKY